MSHSFGESYRVGSTKGIHALTVFCSWDYKVTQKRASRVQQDSICTQLKVGSYLPTNGPRNRVDTQLLQSWPGSSQDAVVVSASWR